MGGTAAAAAKLLQSCPTPCDPKDGSPPGSLSLGFSRQERWSGLPFPSPVHESEKWKGSLSVLSDSSRPHGLHLTRLLRPWDFPDKSTGVGCRCLFQWVALDSTTMKHLHSFLTFFCIASSRCFHSWSGTDTRCLYDWVKPSAFEGVGKREDAHWDPYCSYVTWEIYVSWHYYLSNHCHIGALIL